MIVRLNTLRSSIYTSAWTVFDGKGSLLLLVAESRLQSVAASSLDLETTGIHRFLVRDLESKNQSSSLSASERKYSQVEKEAHSIVFGVKHFHTYLYGRAFTIVTPNHDLGTQERNPSTRRCSIAEVGLDAVGIQLPDRVPSYQCPFKC